MPVSGPAGPKAPTLISSPLTGPQLGCKAFRNDPRLAKIFASAAAKPIIKGAPRSETVKTVQACLYSLGYVKLRAGIDGAFGNGTAAALKELQAKANLPQTGELDRATLQALDKAAQQQIADLKAAKVSPETKKGVRLVVDMADPKKTRLYVIRADEQIEARYLSSPGVAEHPTTHKSNLIIHDVLPRQPWNPPASPWASELSKVPPGIDNPMGILKLSLGVDSQYLHGIPLDEEKSLGHAASHGCVRLSGSNILEVSERYVEPGTGVLINRNAALSAKLEAQFGASGVSERPTEAGREFMFGYLSGELGVVTHLPPKPRA
jgi:hypothetical protein